MVPTSNIAEDQGLDMSSEWLDHSEPPRTCSNYSKGGGTWRVRGGSNLPNLPEPLRYWARLLSKGHQPLLQLLIAQLVEMVGDLGGYDSLSPEPLRTRGNMVGRVM